MKEQDKKNMSNTGRLSTEHLELTAATVEHLCAETESPERLASLLEAQVESGWPPGEYDREAREYFLNRMKEGGAGVIGWYGWYAVLRETPYRPAVLVGAGGYLGPPNEEGAVEIGFSVMPAWQGLGYATELAAALVKNAFTDIRVKKIAAHTAPENLASRRVLEKCGFRAACRNGESEGSCFEILRGTENAQSILSTAREKKMILECKGHKPRIGKNVFIAPNATIIGNVEIGDNSGVWYNTVIRGDMDAIIIGKNTNIQDNCTLHADEGKPTVIGDNVTVGHNAVVHGCTVEDSCLIGIHSTVLNGAVIRKGSIVGSNAVVPEGREVGPYHLVTGIPASLKKELTPDIVEVLQVPADIYFGLAGEHRKNKVCAE